MGAAAYLFRKIYHYCSLIYLGLLRIKVKVMKEMRSSNRKQRYQAKKEYSLLTI